MKKFSGQASVVNPVKRKKWFSPDSSKR